MPTWYSRSCPGASSRLLPTERASSADSAHSSSPVKQFMFNCEFHKYFHYTTFISHNTKLNADIRWSFNFLEFEGVPVEDLNENGSQIRKHLMTALIAVLQKLLFTWPNAGINKNSQEIQGWYVKATDFFLITDDRNLCCFFILNF